MEDVRPYLANVFRGRLVPAARIEEVVRHYARFGGRSPLTELTFRQAAALEALLRERGLPLPVRVGMRNWAPYLRDALRELREMDARRVLGIVMAPHQSYASWDQYRENVEEARQQVGDGAPEVDFVGPWFDGAGFVEAQAQRVAEALRAFAPEGRPRTRSRCRPPPGWWPGAWATRCGGSPTRAAAGIRGSPGWSRTSTTSSGRWPPSGRGGSWWSRWASCATTSRCSTTWTWRRAVRRRGSASPTAGRGRSWTTPPSSPCWRIWSRPARRDGAGRRRGRGDRRAGRGPPAPGTRRGARDRPRRRPVGGGAASRGDHRDRPGAGLPRGGGPGLLPHRAALGDSALRAPRGAPPSRPPGRRGAAHLRRPPRSPPPSAAGVPAPGALPPPPGPHLVPVLVAGEGAHGPGPRPAPLAGRVRREPRSLRHPTPGEGGPGAGGPAPRGGDLHRRPSDLERGRHDAAVSGDGTALPEPDPGDPAHGSRRGQGALRPRSGPFRQPGRRHGDARAGPRRAPPPGDGPVRTARGRGRAARDRGLPGACALPLPRPGRRRDQRRGPRRRRRHALPRGIAPPRSPGPGARAPAGGHPLRVVGRRDPGVPARGHRPPPGRLRLRGAEDRGVPDPRVHFLQREIPRPGACRQGPPAGLPGRRPRPGRGGSGRRHAHPVGGGGRGTAPPDRLPAPVGPGGPPPGRHAPVRGRPPRPGGGHRSAGGPSPRARPRRERLPRGGDPRVHPLGRGDGRARPRP